jgi:hypothetical protein
VALSWSNYAGKVLVELKAKVFHGSFVLMGLSQEEDKKKILFFIGRLESELPCVS